jgi:hypothetical protein
MHFWQKNYAVFRIRSVDRCLTGWPGCCAIVKIILYWERMFIDVQACPGRNPAAFTIPIQ